MTFPFIETCSGDNRSADTVVADLDGTLLCSSNSFPYFALLCFEIGGPLRLLLLLLISPVAAFLYYFISESAGVQVLIFASLAGAKLSSVESAARAVLPKFYAEDLHPETWRVFSACGRRCVLTANPTVMVAPFLKDYLGADTVIGTELQVYMGRVTGLVRHPGVLVGDKKADALRRVFSEDSPPEIGIGDRKTDFPFMSICKEAYVVQRKSGVEPVNRVHLPKPIVFHDGRLVQKQTPLLAALTVLWFPVGLILAVIRIAAGSILPVHLALPALRALGVRVHVHGTPPPPPTPSSSGVLFVCSHRTLLDPVFLSFVLRRSVPALTYSLSRLSEILSPIKTVRLTRNRAHDAAAISRILRNGDLAICPEGTTCREPFLLRFSALFAELTDDIMPVAIEARASLFHGTTARGWKGFDSFYFFMNPSPVYEVSFLSKLPAEWTCGGGERKSYEVANYVQRMIAGRLMYECTNLTRKDKYRALAGNDGVVAEKAVKIQGGGGGGGVCWGAIWGKVRTRAWFYIKTGCWFSC